MKTFLQIFPIPKGIELTEEGKTEWLGTHVRHWCRCWNLGFLSTLVALGFREFSEPMFDKFVAGDWGSALAWVMFALVVADLIKDQLLDEIEKFHAERNTVLADYRVRYYRPTEEEYDPFSEDN